MNNLSLRWSRRWSAKSWVPRANAVGSVTWTWEIGPNTGAGTALATIVCGAGTLRRRFTIR